VRAADAVLEDQAAARRDKVKEARLRREARVAQKKADILATYTAEDDAAKQ